MQHIFSKSDKEYLKGFKNATLDLSTFHHEQHLLITYTLLIENSMEDSYKSIKKGILGILSSVGADMSKYHETMTYGWVLIVKYFMNNTKECKNFGEFISLNKILLDTNILYKYYSKELINSEKARLEILTPDIKKIEI